MADRRTFPFVVKLTEPTIIIGRSCCKRNGETWDVLLLRVLRAESRRLDGAGIARVADRPAKRVRSFPAVLGSDPTDGVHYSRKRATPEPTDVPPDSPTP